MEEKFEKLYELCDKNSKALQKVCDRLDSLEAGTSSSGGSGAKSLSFMGLADHDYLSAKTLNVDNEVSFKRKPSSSQPVGPPNPFGVGPSIRPSMRLQAEFRTIEDAYSRQQLEDNEKFFGTRAGIKTGSRETAVVIGNTAKFTETILKIVAHVHSHAREPDVCINDQLSQIHLCAVAQLKYLQDEQNSLVMGNRFGPRVGQIFKDIRQNTTAFTPEAIEDAKNAIALAGAEEAAKLPSAKQNNSFRGNFRYRGRGRACGTAFANQFNDQQNPGFVPRQVSTERPNSD